MGRGRSKARQTKVARDLKYATHEMDLDQLAKELHSETKNENPSDLLEDLSEENYRKNV